MPTLAYLPILVGLAAAGWTLAIRAPKIAQSLPDKPFWCDVCMSLWSSLLWLGVGVYVGAWTGVEALLAWPATLAASVLLVRAANSILPPKIEPFDKED